MINKHQNMIRHLCTIFFLFSVVFSAPAYSDFLKCEMTSAKELDGEFKTLAQTIKFTIPHSDFRIKQYTNLSIKMDSEFQWGQWGQWEAANG